MLNVRMDNYRDEMLEDLSKLVSIPSVCTKAEGRFPLGRESARALEFVLKRASEMGLAVRNVGNYAGHAEYGSGAGIAAAVAHVDVVPAGSGWHTPPFVLTRNGDIIYGRGTADDKGAAIAALYALKAIKDAGTVGRRRLRVIFGAGEELNSGDLEKYFEKEPLPDMCFTPDSEYGICNREKGILHLKLTDTAKNSSVISKFISGTVVNAVPGTAEAEICCTPKQCEKVKAAAEAKGNFEIETAEHGIKIISTGRAAHAMMPQNGVNAAARLIILLSEVFTKDALGSFFTFLAKHIGMETNGLSMGIAQSDRESGELTLNLGLVCSENGGQWAGIDIRYPVTSDGDKIINKVRSAAGDAGLETEVRLDNRPLYVPEDSRLIQILKDAYYDVMGNEANIYSTGGGTYAREMRGHAVAFGPLFPEEPDRRLHNSDEHIDINYYMRHAQVCLEAMYRMFTA